MSFDIFGDFETRGYLRNALALSDLNEVKRHEWIVSRVNIERALRNLFAPDRAIGYDDLLSTHRILFQGFYSWAGQDRGALAPGKLILKGGRAWFAHPDDCRSAAEIGLKIGNRIEDIVDSPGSVLGHLAHSHPFLEGNGRAILVVFTALSRRAGFTVDWSRTDKLGYLTALTAQLETPQRRPLDQYLKPFINFKLSRSMDSI